jgi:hypothetical protein
MKIMQRKSISLVTLLMAGMILIGVAIFADVLGLDKGEGWGRARILALVFGALLTLGSIYYYRYGDKVRFGIDRVRSFLDKYPITSGILKNQKLADLSGWYRNYKFTLPAVVLVILIYIWFVSAGTWTTWISPTRYYADLARGFQRGVLHLPTRPDPLLLQLSDPYDPAVRWEVEAPLDITYYEGKYYLYWGPVPALILLGVNTFVNGRVGDLFLVFGFVCGIFLSQVILLITVWDHFFRALPKWLLFISILLAGLASPVTFMLDHINSARIYEAAITGGQFFLMSGLVVAVSDSRRYSSSLRLALMGILWALAIGTRLTLAVPIGLMTLIIAHRILISQGLLISKLTRLISLGVPLAMGFVCLGWYNWARFGSVIETGYYYQLAGPHLQKYYDLLFHPAYILQNLYNYLLNPFEIQSQFPFFYPELGRRDAIVAFFSMPEIYSAQLITGIFYTVPFVAFAVIPFGVFVYDRFRKTDTQTPVMDGRLAPLNWITLMLGICSLSALAMLSVFFWAGMRYSEDFMPSLMMLSVIGFLQRYHRLLHKRKERRFHVAFGLIMGGASILISTLLAISVNAARLD